jgi:inorganic pyrophosphatase
MIRLTGSNVHFNHVFSEEDGVEGDVLQIVVDEVDPHTAGLVPKMKALQTEWTNEQSNTRILTDYDDMWQTLRELTNDTVTSLRGSNLIEIVREEYEEESDTWFRDRLMRGDLTLRLSNATTDDKFKHFLVTSNNEPVEWAKLEFHDISDFQTRFKREINSYEDYYENLSRLYNDTDTEFTFRIDTEETHMETFDTLHDTYPTTALMVGFARCNFYSLSNELTVGMSKRFATIKIRQNGGVSKILDEELVASSFDESIRDIFINWDYNHHSYLAGSGEWARVTTLQFTASNDGEEHSLSNMIRLTGSNVHFNHVFSEEDGVEGDVIQIVVDEVDPHTAGLVPKMKALHTEWTNEQSNTRILTDYGDMWQTLRELTNDTVTSLHGTNLLEIVREEYDGSEEWYSDKLMRGDLTLRLSNDHNHHSYLTGIDEWARVTTLQFTASNDAEEHSLSNMIRLTGSNVHFNHVFSEEDGVEGDVIQIVVDEVDPHTAGLVPKMKDMQIEWTNEQSNTRILTDYDDMWQTLRELTNDTVTSLKGSNLIEIVREEYEEDSDTWFRDRLMRGDLTLRLSNATTDDKFKHFLVTSNNEPVEWAKLEFHDISDFQTRFKREIDSYEDYYENLSRLYDDPINEVVIRLHDSELEEVFETFDTLYDTYPTTALMVGFARCNFYSLSNELTAGMSARFATIRTRQDGKTKILDDQLMVDEFSETIRDIFINWDHNHHSYLAGSGEWARVTTLQFTASNDGEEHSLSNMIRLTGSNVHFNHVFSEEDGVEGDVIQIVVDEVDPHTAGLVPKMKALHTEWTNEQSNTRILTDYGDMWQTLRELTNDTVTSLHGTNLLEIVREEYDGSEEWYSDKLMRGDLTLRLSNDHNHHSYLTGIDEWARVTTLQFTASNDAEEHSLSNMIRLTGSNVHFNHVFSEEDGVEGDVIQIVVDEVDPHTAGLVPKMKDMQIEWTNEQSNTRILTDYDDMWQTLRELTNDTVTSLKGSNLIEIVREEYEEDSDTWFRDRLMRGDLTLRLSNATTDDKFKHFLVTSNNEPVEWAKLEFHDISDFQTRFKREIDSYEDYYENLSRLYDDPINEVVIRLHDSELEEVFETFDTLYDTYPTTALMVGFARCNFYSLSNELTAGMSARFATIRTRQDGKTKILDDQLMVDEFSETIRDIFINWDHNHHSYLAGSGEWARVTTLQFTASNDGEEHSLSNMIRLTGSNVHFNHVFSEEDGVEGDVIQIVVDEVDPHTAGLVPKMKALHTEWTNEQSNTRILTDYGTCGRPSGSSPTTPSPRCTGPICWRSFERSTTAARSGTPTN